MAEEILIDFKVDYSELDAAFAALEKTGAVDKKLASDFKAVNDQVAKQGKLAKDSAQGVANLKKAFNDVKTSATQMGASVEKAFNDGVNDALAQAGVSAQEFQQALSGVDKSSKSLKAQLREMVQQLAAMKVAGEDNTVEYRKLSQQAGQLKDSIADANQEVKNFGSDTATFDGLISAVSGLAGGFAVVQGASALFGDESEELQKTLLKVNAAMAILQGLQQIQTVLQKESAAATLASTIATRAQTFAQGALSVVVGTSTGALKAFRIALAATGIGLLVVGIIALYEALKDSNDELEEANRLIEDQGRIVESTTEVIKRRTDVEAATADAAGKAQSKITAIRGRGLLKEREALLQSSKNLAAQREALDATSEAWSVLNTQIEANNDAIRGIDNQLVLQEIAYQGQLADERKAAAEKAKADREKAAEEAKKARNKDFQDFKALVELQVLAATEGSEAQLEARKRLLNAELQLSLDNEELTLNQRRVLIQQYFKDSLALTKEFGRAQTEQFRQNAISEANTALQQLEISTADRLLATEQLLKEQASIEIAAAQGNATKIREIAAKRDADIRAARLASIQTTLEYELALETANNGPSARRLAATIANANIEIGIRRDAIDEQATQESNAILKRKDALNEEFRQRLISQKDYNLQYAQLVDQNRVIWENAEKAKTDATKAEEEKRKAARIKAVQDTVEVLNVVNSFFSSLNQLATEQENARIEEQKARLKALVDAGAITEKEAMNRTKRLEAEERQARQRQAQRQKQEAVFNAFLAIPQAFLRGLQLGGPILAAVFGGIAAVQAGLVAARPIPKFARGKKNRWSGIGEVGEAGYELIQRKQGWELASKRTQTYIGPDDKVFTHQESRRMLEGMSMGKISQSGGSQPSKIDYERLGKEFAKAKSSTNINIDRDFISDSVANGLSKNRSFDKRYKF